MESLQPPKLASRIFDWYSGHANVEDLRGDLDENFYRNIKKKSIRKARALYWKQVISLITSYALWKRKRKSNYSETSLYNQLTMLQNYFKVAFRNLIKQKYFAIINIIGLAIGMSVSLLVIAMVTFIFSYEDFQENKDRIYRITSTITEGIETREYAIAPAVLANKLAEESTTIEKVVRINSTFAALVTHANTEIPLKGYFTDPNFLDLFSFPLLEGNPATALHKPNQVLITVTAAKKLFNTESALGKIISIEGIGECEVTGVLADIPKNTHLDFEVLCSYNTLRGVYSRNQQDAWRDFSSEYIYFLAKPNADLTALRAELASIEKEIYTEKDHIKASFQIQALSDITLGLELRNGLGEQWDLVSMITFGTLSLMILLPACFNYSNISIARALKRSKEIGLRKALGSLKQQIFVQFITETVVITLISLFLACFIFVLIRAEFLSMLVASNKLDLSLTPEMLLGFLLFALLAGLAAGTVPALYFSRLNPIQALKSSGSGKTFSVSKVRKGLTVAQFVLSFSFIIGLVVFSKQYRYSLNFDFGFQQANVLDVNLQDVQPSNFDTHFSSLASVKNISYSSSILGLGASQTYAKSQGQSDSTEVFQLFVDEHYLSNLDLTLLAGQNFTNEDRMRERSIIVNEEFLVKHNIATPADALGKVYTVDSLDLQIIGVVKNFHFMSLREPIYSFFFRCNASQFQYANLNIASTDIDATLSGMESTWKKLSPETKFESKFFEQEIAESFDSYKVLLKMVGFLGVLAISISCLGLLGMVVYTTEGKTKEVGIRKVMGASAGSITYLLSKDYIKLMLIAVVIATPITWWFFDKFLSQLQYYRVSIDVFDVLISIVILMTLGLGAIATQTLRTAATNPAETLKYE